MKVKPLPYFMYLQLHVILPTLLIQIGFGNTQKNNAVRYGVDISWPVHALNISTVDNTQPLGDRQSFYDTFFHGCVETWSNYEECYECEEGRVYNNLIRMKYMKNFTTLGFEKMKTPEHVFKPLAEFYEKNKDKQRKEDKESGDTTNNYWESPSYLLDTARVDLIGGGDELLQQPLLKEVGKLLTKWFNIPLKYSMMYGIRIYTDGSILNPHVDDLPRIASAIINIAQSDDCEDWPLEVIGHDGFAYNITMKPGDMVLYEAHSLIHGRPFPLSGSSYANLFVHFEPDIIHNKSELPMYITGDVPEDAKIEIMKELNDFNSADSENNSKDSEDEEDLRAHIFAADNNLTALKSIAQTDKSKLLNKDRNGWTPLHEAVRAGDIDIINYLLGEEVGSDLYAVTYNELNVFDLAEENNEIYELLKSFENKNENNEEF